MLKKISATWMICTVCIFMSVLCSCTQTSSPVSSSNDNTVSVTAETKANAGSYTQISQDEAARLMETESNYIILDVRTPEEFAQGHIPNSINIPVENIADTPPAELADHDQLIMVYCRSGNRSKTASQKLVELGYTNVKEFGGINTWTGPVTTD